MTRGLPVLAAEAAIQDGALPDSRIASSYQRVFQWMTRLKPILSWIAAYAAMTKVLVLLITVTPAEAGVYAPSGRSPLIYLRANGQP